MRRNLASILVAVAVVLTVSPTVGADQGGARGSRARRVSIARPHRANEHSFRRRLGNERSFRGRPGPRRERVARRPPTGRGRLEQRVLDGRELFIYLPPGYRPGDRRRYPVLILQDGQNLFGEGERSWQVHRAIDAEVQAGRAEPVIVVGIPARPSHEGRVGEYAVQRDEAEGLGGGGAEYIDFVADRVVPWLRRELPVRAGAQSVAIGGSSMGARIAIEAALARPDSFGKVLALSPSVWFNDGEILRRIEGGDPLPATAQIYLDSGGSGRSRDDADNVARLRDALLARSFEHGSWQSPKQRTPRRLWHWIEPGHEHDETAWRERFPRALRVVFPAD